MRYIKDYTTFLNENMNQYTNDVKLETPGDYEHDYQTLVSQLDIIHKYFHFTTVKGYYNYEEGAHLIFNTFEIKGDFNTEPYIVEFIIDDNIYNFDIYPFDSMGGFDISSFENNIKQLKTEIDTVSIVISNDLYAAKSITLRKDELDDYEIYIVNGTQIEGKRVGVTTTSDKSNYKKKSEI